MSNIHLIKGDITTATTDAIVNAANPGLTCGGGVNWAIHKAAGQGMVDECKLVPEANGVRCPPGSVRVTGPGRMRNTKCIIHAVGPRYGLDENPEFLLANCYWACLDVATKLDCQSIAFPALSCGAYRYPPVEAAEVAMRTCSLDRYKHMEIYFYLHNDVTMAAWEEAK